MDTTLIYKPIISVIVPVYNVEKYLIKSIDSIRNQTIKELEIILVDDGSTDTGGILCDKFADMDNRIKVYHTVNRGVSHARNVGLHYARGGYIGFVDPDDYIETNMYEFLYSNIKRYSADIAICGRNNIYAYNTRQDRYFKSVCTPEEAFIIEICNEGYSSCNKLFCRTVLQDVSYDTSIINGEDRLFVFEAFCNSCCIVYDCLPLYNYFHRSNSAGTSNFKYDDYTLIKACEQTIDIIRHNFPNKISYGEKMLWEAKQYLVGKILLSDNETNYIEILQLLRKDIRENTHNIISNRHISFARKIATIVIGIDPSLYKIAIKIKHKKQKKVSNH